ncbi:MAG: efflux RND transporter periplasmic adaptor subunit [Ignavibacteria bacterium]|nr:efflux RND transporter periplasmic adaptor subunit [Ignavibacteria bacterium]
MKNKKVVFVIIALIILAVIIIPKLDFSSKSESTDGQTSGRRGIRLSVNAIVIKPQKLQNIIFTNGTTLSSEEVELRSETSGKIIKILFEEGKKVKAGDLLVKINDAELQATLKKNYSREALARDKELRFKQLLEKNLTSQQEYDVAQSELVSVSADIEFTKAQIQKTEIVAPFDGVVGLRSVSVGSYISPQTVIATLQNINPIKVDFSIPQKYFGVLTEGKVINVKVGSSGRNYKGRVYAVEPKIDQSTRTVKARALVSNERSELNPGAYVEIEVVLEDLSSAFLIPTEALIPDLEGEKVYLFRNKKAALQPVRTGIRSEKEIQIISGVNLGDTVITSGIIQLRQNMPVTINSILN